MIDSYTGTPMERPRFYNDAPAATPMQLNTLTLERNTVLIARVSKDAGYSIDELHVLREALKNTFPCHSVFVWYDDIEFMAVHDKAYKPEGLIGLNNETSNYY